MNDDTNKPEDDKAAPTATENQATKPDEKTADAATTPDPIEAEGQKFDPHKHQAMFEVPDPSRPEGTVVQVVQAGFAIGDRVLRPAMVGIAKGGGANGQPAEGSVDKSA